MDIKDKIDNIIAVKNGKLISNIGEYKNAKTKLTWQCFYGHTFVSDWNHIQRGQWCPFCAGRYITIDFIKHLAIERGGKCLSNTYVKCADKLLWECAIGHQWFAPLNHVKNNNSWCPYCCSSVGENICRKYFEYAFGYKFPKVRLPSFLSASGHRLELDGYCKELNIAFEYNGSHHMYKIYKNQNLSKVQQHDLLKIDLCKKNNISLITINEDINQKDKKKYIKNILIKEFKNMNIIRDISQYDISNDDLYNYNLSSELSNIATIYGGKCLDSEYRGSHYKYTWECAMGHIWNAQLQSVKAGSWCNLCNNPDIMDSTTIIYHLSKIRDEEKDVFKKRIINKSIQIIEKNSDI